MSPELQNFLIKYVGGLIQSFITFACVKWLPNNPEAIALIVGPTAAAYGGIAFTTPINGIRKAEGLVSVRAPSPSDVDKMREVVAVADSMRPPAGNGGES